MQTKHRHPGTQVCQNRHMNNHHTRYVLILAAWVGCLLGVGGLEMGIGSVHDAVWAALLAKLTYGLYGCLGVLSPAALDAWNVEKRRLNPAILAIADDVGPVILETVSSAIEKKLPKK